jgi:hypothetical protein
MSAWEYLQNLSWPLLWLIFALTLWDALHDHRENRERVKNSFGKAKQRALFKLVRSWAIPILAFIAAAIGQLGSDALEVRLAPRTISQEDGDRIKAVLMNFDPVKITVMYANTDAEASHFASDIESLLTQAKYPYADIPVTVVGDPPGLYFGVNDPTNTPPVCPTLQKTLSNLNIKATWRRDSRVPLGEIGIVVGSKPIQ